MKNKFRHLLDNVSPEVKREVHEYGDTVVFCDRLDKGVTYKGVLCFLIKILHI